MPQKSAFNQWLRANGHERFCSKSDKSKPLTSRIAELQKRGFEQEETKELVGLWEQWQGRDRGGRKGRP